MAMPGDPNEDPLYEKVNRMVLEGHTREDVYRSMEMNGITGKYADELFSSAWKERAELLGKDSSRRLRGGLLLMLGSAAAGAFASLPPAGFYVLCAGVFYGAWKTLAGLRERREAAAKKGPVWERPRIFPGGRFP